MEGPVKDGAVIHETAPLIDVISCWNRSTRRATDVIFSRRQGILSFAVAFVGFVGHLKSKASRENRVGWDFVLARREEEGGGALPLGDAGEDGSGGGEAGGVDSTGEETLGVPSLGVGTDAPSPAGPAGVTPKPKLGITSESRQTILRSPDVRRREDLPRAGCRALFARRSELRLGWGDRTRRGWSLGSVGIGAEGILGLSEEDSVSLALPLPEEERGDIMVKKYTRGGAIVGVRGQDGALTALPLVSL